MDPNSALPQPCIKVARVREQAPDFACDAVISGRFEERSLEYYISRRQWLMLFFIPMAFSFVCPTEVLAFDNVLEEFTELNCSVVFVSTDSKYSLHSWQTRPKNEGGLGEIDVPLLSDQNHKMSRAYGVLVEEGGFALRGRFIINPEGMVKHISINDVAVGRSVLESLRLLQAYRAEYEEGVFCAANWKPGEETLKPTAEATQKHINRHFKRDSNDDPIEIAPPARQISHKSDSSADHKSPHVRSPSRGRPRGDSGPTTPRNFALEAISKVFGNHSRGENEPQTPLAGVEEMDALNEANEKRVRGHHRSTPGGAPTQQSYFDYEPFAPSPLMEKKNPLSPLVEKKNPLSGIRSPEVRIEEEAN